MYRQFVKIVGKRAAKIAVLLYPIEEQELRDA